jgi:hypothetical protein
LLYEKLDKGLSGKLATFKTAPAYIRGVSLSDTLPWRFAVVWACECLWESDYARDVSFLFHPAQRVKNVNAR